MIACVLDSAALTVGLGVFAWLGVMVIRVGHGLLAAIAEQRRLMREDPHAPWDWLNPRPPP